MLEKPTNKTQATYYKAGQELIDMMLVLDGGGRRGWLQPKHRYGYVVLTFIQFIDTYNWYNINALECCLFFLI